MSSVLRNVVVTHALRSPIGRFMGGLARLTASDLGTQVVRALLREAALDPARVEQVIFGCARQAGNGPNPARPIAVRSGIPESTPAYTVNQACGSGLRAIILAAQAIGTGDCDVAIAGGTESMSRVPFLLDRFREGYGFGDAEVVDAMYRDGFLCPLANQVMGATVETLAERFSIGRDEQDEFAAETQRRCEEARKAGRFAVETTAVSVPADPKTGAAETTVDRDEHPRDGVTVESLAKLKPVFKGGGTIHAGNSSGITDGAAALVLMDARTAETLELEPLARIGASATAGVDPSMMGIGPVPAVEKLCERTLRNLDDFDLIEINEAFAAQVLACDRELGFDRDRVNVNGGAIALGHPIGATGARIVVTLLHEMARRQAQSGLATLCVSGGLGIATSFHRD